MTDKAQYTKSAEQEYKEALRATDEEKAAAADEGRSMTVEGNDTSAYIGTDAVYQNYSNDTEKPYAPEDDSADAGIVEEFVAVQQASVKDLTTGEEGDENDAKPATADATLVRPAAHTSKTGKADTK